MNSQLRLHAIQEAVAILQRRVSQTMATQPWIRAGLEEHKRVALELIASIQRISDIIPAQDQLALERSITTLLSRLEHAIGLSHDPPCAISSPVAKLENTGRKGRPKIQIDNEFLARGLGFRSQTQLAPIVGCSTRTLRRRALEANLLHPGRPVFVEVLLENGSSVRMHARSSQKAPSTLSDDELDVIMVDILQAFPRFGRKMITGHLKYYGHVVTKERVRDSYIRVKGFPPSWGRPTIERTPYCVAGPNALWHHDGQHGLIRYRIVIHGFIDGFSRLIVGMRANPDNTPETVLQLFLDAVEVHGCPSRCRGDHGWENILVAAFMESEDGQGPNRGSYIFGRSVHNIRVERLWWDFTLGPGHIWKNLFAELELHAGLDINNDAHMWLLHFLFLDALNDDITNWIGTWNKHKIDMRDQQAQCPEELFYFGCLEKGLRGRRPGIFEEEDTLDIEDRESYGIDWEDLNDPQLRRSMDQRESDDTLTNPGGFSRVDVPTHECPLSNELIQVLREGLGDLCGPLAPKSMLARKQIWIAAEQICRRIALHEVATVRVDGPDASLSRSTSHTCPAS